MAESDVGLRILGRLTTVRPATELDAEMLAGWHADLDVMRYWGGKSYSTAQMLERLRRPDVEAFVVEEGRAPVGYIQAWRGADREGGLDMFLIPPARGRGLGPDAARALAGHLVHDRGWRRLTVDVDIGNERGVRAWRSAGFDPVEERAADAEHDAPWILMEFRE